MDEMDNVGWFIVGVVMTGLLALAVFLAWLLFPLIPNSLVMEVKDMICPQCGEMNPPEAEECTSCGANLLSPRMIVCEGCGVENPITNRFCEGCGRLLARPEVAFRPKEVEAEVEEEPSRGFPLTYIILAILLVLAALALYVYFMSR